jgi:hypothetical protein
LRIVTETTDAPSRLYHTYVRSGRVESGVRYSVNDEETIELSLAESLPLVGGLVGGLLAGIGLRFRNGWQSRRGTSDLRSDGGTGRTRAADGLFETARRLPERIREATPARQTDGFALLIFAGYATLYFPLLPLHTQLTVRYVLPVVPALVYLVARRQAVRRTVAVATRSLVVSYTVALGIGILVVGVTFPALDPAVGEAMQLHALVNLAVCGTLLGTVAAARAGFVDDTRPVAVALGVAGGATTLLVVRMQLVYFEYGTYAVPVVRRVADALAAAV